MRDALQAGMHADSKFKSRQKMNAAKNIQGLNNISAERLVSPLPKPTRLNSPPGFDGRTEARCGI